MTRSPDDALVGNLTWAALADMRPHRLKRGKHFALPPRDLQQLAQEAASTLELAVHTVRDELRRFQYVWVQFAEFQVPPGAPCPRCGGLRLLRTGAQFVRCEACDARLLVVVPKGSGGTSRPPAVETEPLTGAETPAGVEEAEDRADPPADELARLFKWAGRTRLDSYQNVHMVHDEDSSDDRFERWYGRGSDLKGRPGVLEVVYPLRGSVRVPDPRFEGQDVYRVSFWSLSPIRRARQLGVLDGWSPAGFLGSPSMWSED